MKIKYVESIYVGGETLEREREKREKHWLFSESPYVATQQDSPPLFQARRKMHDILISTCYNLGTKIQ